MKKEAKPSLAKSKRRRPRYVGHAKSETTTTPQKTVSISANSVSIQDQTATFNTDWADDFNSLMDETEDMVNHPPHYTQHPSGVECIEITEHMGFCLGNAVKYIWRAGEKGDTIENLKKARWYIDREIQKLESGKF